MVEKVSDAANLLEDINHTLNQPDRSNLFRKEVGLELSQRQIDLLRRIVKADKGSEKQGDIWYLVEAIGKTSVYRASANSQIELDVDTQDIHALSQAGHIRGYYSNNTFYFYIAPSAEFVANSDGDEFA
jgi:hypothetical protein